MTDDEQFFAWLDGELDADAASLVEARVRASPALSARAEEHRRLAEGLHHAFAPVMAASAPAPKFEGAEVVDLSSRSAKPGRRAWLSGPQWFAAAASLAVGIVVGTQLLPGPTAESGQGSDDLVVASSALDRALDTQLASVAGAGLPRVGLTFRGKSGELCRTYRDVDASGLACREGDAWRIKGAFRPAEGQSADYRMASGEDPRLAELVDQKIAGEPFDADQERRALENGWR